VTVAQTSAFLHTSLSSRQVKQRIWVRAQVRTDSVTSPPSVQSVWTRRKYTAQKPTRRV